MTISKTAAWAAAGIIGSGAIAGVTYAAVATPATATPATANPATANPATAGTSAADSVDAAATAGPRGMRGRALLSRLEHGELTLRGRSGDVTVDLQRGSVVAVTPTSITVRSLDRYQHTYTVTGSTKVRSGKSLGSISDVHSGDKVFVVSKGDQALRIMDRS